MLLEAEEHHRGRGENERGITPGWRSLGLAIPLGFALELPTKLTLWSPRVNQGVDNPGPGRARLYLPK